METTRPFLYIDLEKALWKEELHKRDAQGRFTTVRTGSKIVTSTGKTGVVHKITEDHYHVTYADGTKGKVVKGNAIHENDHKRIAEAKKKGKKVAAATEKGKTTKAANKANGTGKAVALSDGAGKTASKPKASEVTVKKQSATSKPKASEALIQKEQTVAKKGVAKVKETYEALTGKKAGKMKTDELIAQTNKAKRSIGNAGADASLNSPEKLKTKEVALSSAGKKAPKPIEEDRQNQAIQQYSEVEQDTEATKGIDSMWNSPEVKRLMQKAPNKRREADIRRIAGGITSENDKLARYVTLQMGKSRGLNLLSQVNKIGDVGESGNGEVINQETGYYGDLLQAARATMYETLHNIMAGSQNPKQGTSIAAHVINRMKNKLHNDIYDIMNEIPAPAEIRGAIADMNKTEQALEQQLGRTPSVEELAKQLQATSKHFKEAPIMEAPQYDEKAGKWVAVKKRVSDPVERLNMLKMYTEQQKTTDIDQNVGSTGEKEVALSDSLTDATSATPDEIYERKERQREMQDAVPKLLSSLGLNDKEQLVFSLMFGNASSKIKKDSMTQDEVADEINKRGGYEGVDAKGKKTIGNQATQSWVNKYYRSALQKIMEAKQNNHPALEEVYNKFFKSFVFDMIMKSVYEYELVKSLVSWGVGVDMLTTQYVRSIHGSSLYSLRKSLLPHEYIGSVVTTEDGGIHARIVEYALPDDNMLYKSFNASMDSLKKSMFPHKGKSNHEVNKKASDYIKANKAKYTSLSDKQHAAAQNKGNGLTWSEQLLLKNKGSAWITWGGKRVLVNVGDGSIIYDSANEAHRESHNQGAQEDKIDFQHEKDTLASEGSEDTPENRVKLDHGIQAFKEQMEDMRREWHGDGDKLGIRKEFLNTNEHKAHGMYSELTDEEKEAFDNMDTEGKREFLGKRLLEKPEVKKAIEAYKNGEDSEENRNKLISVLKDAGVASANVKESMVGKSGKSGFLADIRLNGDLTASLGAKELSWAKSSASKNFIPEGTYMIGNPVTGKSMLVKIGSSFEGGRGGKGGKYTQTITEAFDPEGGSHEAINSWAELGKALGFSGDAAKRLQENLVKKANSTEDMPFMQQVSEAEYMKSRANTKLGLQEGMKHKNFRLVNESRGADDKVSSRTYAMDMPDGTQNAVTVDRDGYITDPVMSRLLNQGGKPIENVNDLHEVMKNAVGNRAWVTAHFGSDIHVGDALGHHIQLEYDGKGAPRVIGGKYDGYRFMDSRDIPKDAIDPATGEPIKALFKNGKLVERRFSTKNEVPLKEGNSVLYDAGNGRYRKGRIHSIQDGVYKITDGKHHVIGMFNKSELKPATVEGKTNAESGQAVVRLAETVVHRMDMGDFGDNAKAKELFNSALAKAKIKASEDDKLELNDKEYTALKKILGRSKAGRTMLEGFSHASTKDLQVHVPSSLKDVIAAEGVNIGADGTARISVGKFEQLRDVLGGMSIDHNARRYLEEHFNRKDRKPMQARMDEIRKNYQPSKVDPNTDFGKAYQAQFKAYDKNDPEGKKHFLMNPNEGLYDTQLQGVTHLIERKRGIVGHGMGVGKTIEGVVAALHYKADKLAKGEKPKKTLIVSPAGIQSDWGKEIGKHTNSKALYVGSNTMRKKDISGRYMQSENKRSMFGQDGTEQELMTSKDFLNSLNSLGNEDHDFHIMSYEQFRKHRDALAKSGLYDNIIIDEVHAFKNQSGQRGKSLAETTDSFENVWGLSGTPMENDAREVYSLIDTITGGRHELGTRKEFADNYLMKDKNGKIIGIKGDPSDPNSKAAKLGDILANIVQFRNGSDVEYASGEKIYFPQIIGEVSDSNPNPQSDFMGNMVDRSRDHQSTDYYGTKHSVFNYETDTNKAIAKDGSEYEVPITRPTNLTKPQQAFYSKYADMQKQYLPESKLKEIVKAAATGYENKAPGKSDKNYLTGMQKLQKFLNAGANVEKMYVPGGNALDSDLTGEQVASEPGQKAKKVVEGLKKFDPVTGEGHYVVDSNGHKRYFESDGQGSYKRNADGSPKLLPPLHHDNPKAEYLKSRVSMYLDNLANENSRRKASGKPELMPKIVVKSGYTTFGTDIIDNVLRDLEKSHPHLDYWKNKLEAKGQSLGSGQFTGEAENREQTKVGFRGNKDNYAEEQGNLWATTVSPAGKEGVDFGNAHMMLMYDQDWNPQKMAQFTARVRRSDSAKTHAQVGKDNSVRVESLHMPGTIEDFIFQSEDTKMGSINAVTTATRQKEQSVKFGDTEARAGKGSNFTRSGRNAAGAKAKNTKDFDTRRTAKPSPAQMPEQEAAATVDKSIKLVIIV